MTPKYPTIQAYITAHPRESDLDMARAWLRPSGYVRAARKAMVYKDALNRPATPMVTATKKARALIKPVGER